MYLQSVQDSYNACEMFWFPFTLVIFMTKMEFTLLLDKIGCGICLCIGIHSNVPWLKCSFNHKDKYKQASISSQLSQFNSIFYN